MQDKEENCQDFEIRFCCPADLYQTNTDYINFDSLSSLSLIDFSLFEDYLGELKEFGELKELYSLIYSEKDFDFDDYDAGKLSIR